MHMYMTVLYLPFARTLTNISMVRISPGPCWDAVHFVQITCTRLKDSSSQRNLKKKWVREGKRSTEAQRVQVTCSQLYSKPGESWELKPDLTKPSSVHEPLDPLSWKAYSHFQLHSKLEHWTKYLAPSINTDGSLNFLIPQIITTHIVVSCSTIYTIYGLFSQSHK